MTFLLQSAIDAISLGALYALEALVVGLLFGIMRLANFALSAGIVACGYSLYLMRELSLAEAVAGGVLVGVVFSLLTERLVFRRLRGAREATLFIASFAIAYGVENLAMLLFGSQSLGVALGPLFAGTLHLGGLAVANLSVITVAVAGVLLALVVGFLRVTSIGTRMRAACDDFTMVRMLGVGADAVIAVAFAISGVLTAAVAVVVVAQTGGISAGVGTNVVIIALLGAVIGGLDRLAGAALGGFAIGVVMSALTVWLPPEVRPFRDALVAAAVILVLWLRPQGLIPGGTLRERV